MALSTFAQEFDEKMVKKYINQGLWLKCCLSDYYTYLEYYDEGGYSSIYKLMDKATGEYFILKRSSKKDFVPGCLDPHFTKPIDAQETALTKTDLHVSKEAEFTVKIYEKLGGVRLYDYYDDDDHYILIMEDGGRSLDSIVCSHKKKILDLLRYGGCQSNLFYQRYLDQVIQYMIKVYHKIKGIHDLGIHHNDLKPENVLVDGDNNVTIIDFGVSKSIESADTTFGCFEGTLEYIPYEYMVHGLYKPWDHTVWSFGIMLHFLTLMEYPFLKEEDVAHYTLDCGRIDKLPPSFATLIHDCLHRDPSKRPRNLLKRLQDLRDRG